ncbi:hypothetical protein [Haloarcula litorea]|nr:hypothetical protein [Halomicroarcula sp. GDY20]
MQPNGSSREAGSLAARCRRRVATADRGWKATALGVAIVAAVALAP